MNPSSADSVITSCNAPCTAGQLVPVISASLHAGSTLPPLHITSPRNTPRSTAHRILFGRSPNDSDQILDSTSPRLSDGVTVVGRTMALASPRGNQRKISAAARDLLCRDELQVARGKGLFIKHDLAANTANGSDDLRNSHSNGSTPRSSTQTSSMSSSPHTSPDNLHKSLFHPRAVDVDKMAEMSLQSKSMDDHQSPPQSERRVYGYGAEQLIDGLFPSAPRPRSRTLPSLNNTHYLPLVPSTVAPLPLPPLSSHH